MRTIITVEATEARESKLYWNEKARDHKRAFGYMLSEAEAYELEKELNKQWLFDTKKPLEDDYSEESEP